MRINKKTSIVAVILIAIVIIGAVSVWSFLSRQANKSKTYSGAKFIICNRNTLEG